MELVGSLPRCPTARQEDHIHQVELYQRTKWSIWEVLSSVGNLRLLLWLFKFTPSILNKFHDFLSEIRLRREVTRYRLWIWLNVMIKDWIVHWHQCDSCGRFYYHKLYCILRWLMNSLEERYYSLSVNECHSHFYLVFLELQTIRLYHKCHRWEKLDATILELNRTDSSTVNM
jgi:hypothetical protein